MKPGAFVSRGLTIDGTPGGADAITGTYTPGAPGILTGLVDHRVSINGELK